MKQSKSKFSVAFFTDGFRRQMLFLAISAPALVWSFFLRGGHSHGAHGWSPGMFADPAWIPVLLCGLPIIVYAARKFAANGNVRAGLLVSIAMIAAVATGEIFAAGEVAFIMALGDALKERALNNARSGIAALMSIAPKQAAVVRGGVETLAPVDDIVAGDIIRVRPGETIAADGEVVAGASSVDQALITGESLPVEKAAGDAVIAGAINRFGSIDIRATRDAKDSTLKKIQQLIENAGNKKAPVVLAADKAASILIPLSVATALAAWAVTGELIRAVSVLVVFCPCALVLATPTAIMAGVANLSRYGILVKDGAALERMGRVAVIAFDKTGTLTTGKLSVAQTMPAAAAGGAGGNCDDGGAAGAKLLALAASAEQPSEHPIGRAIAAALPGAPAPEAFAMLPGKGIEATVGGKKILAGTAAFLNERGIAVEEHRGNGFAAPAASTTVFIAADGMFAGGIALSDTLRPDAREIVAGLKAAGIRQTIMLTGDQSAAAQKIATAAGVDSFEAGLLPAGKVGRIEAMSAAGKRIAMVGDGVNDAAAMKAAAVGIAVGGVANDITVEAADIVLMRDDILMLPHLASMSRRVLRNIAANMAISLAVNAGAISLAVCGLLSPAAGALAHNFGSLLVVGNAALLLRVKPASAAGRD